MSESALPNPEQSTVAELLGAVREIHDAFLEMVPGFGRNTWIPHEAIRNRAGSCAAEAFFVARRLIDLGVCSKEDLFIGVFKNHGEEVTRGLLGITAKDPGHATLFVVTNNTTYELNFRMGIILKKCVFNPCYLSRFYGL